MFDPLLEEDPWVQEKVAEGVAKGMAEGVAKGEFTGALKEAREMLDLIVQSLYPALTASGQSESHAERAARCAACFGQATLECGG